MKKPARKSKDHTPILNSLVIRGSVHWDEKTKQWFGRTVNGERIVLGNDAASAERSLFWYAKPGEVFK